MYSLLRKLLFLSDAEAAHEKARVLLEKLQQTTRGRSLLQTMRGFVPEQTCQTMGLTFCHPVGIAAGFDKDARVVLALQDLGFSFVEIGTVTPRPQPGNPRPRIWRFPEAEALVNALGFPGEGMQAVNQRLAAWRNQLRIQIPVGINIGKNLDTPLDEAVQDFAAVLNCLYDLGDYFVVNVSSPNTPHLRDMQAVMKLQKTIQCLQECSLRRGGKPLLIKIAPDLVNEDVIAIGKLSRQSEIAGLVAANTTLRRDLVFRSQALDRGGLSGKPLFPRTLELIKLLRSELAVSQTLIAVGGISTADQVAACLHAGANLIQVYTSFIYRGPRCVSHLLTKSSGL